MSLADACAAGPTWQLHCSDCLDPVTGMASLGDKSVDHVITDPPYEAEAHTLQRRAAFGPGHGLSTVEEKPIDFDPISSLERARSGLAFGRVSRRWILVFCQAEAVGLWRDAVLGGGAVYKRACIWVKPDGQPQLTGDRPGMGYESIVAAHGPGKSTWNGGGSHGVFMANRKHDNSRPSVHPTEKPINLMEKLVRLFTDPGDLILDPFAGSGTTGVAAIRLGRRFIGFEKDPRYHAIAVKRLAAAREQMEMFREAK